MAEASGKEAVYFLWHFPSGYPDWSLASTLPCGVRTFLSPRTPEGDGTSDHLFGSNRRHYYRLNALVASSLSCLDDLVALQRAYNHMNAGDAAIEADDDEGALREYGAAQTLLPDHAEMLYWHAVALVNMGRVEGALPMFRRVFAMDPNWETLLPRLPRSGLLPDDPALIERILRE